MVNYIKNRAEKHQKGLFASFLCVIILVGAFYIYCVGAIVIETANRNQNFQNLQVEQKEYQELEKKYLDLISKFNLDYAYSLGFVGENPLVYVSRQIPVAQSSGYDKALR
jgi:hypothetical protein